MFCILEVSLSNPGYGDSSYVDHVKYMKSFAYEEQAIEYQRDINLEYTREMKAQFAYFENYRNTLVVPPNLAGILTQNELYEKIRRGIYKVDDYHPPVVNAKRVDTDDWHIVEIPDVKN